MLSEHHRLGSRQVILSRDFSKLLETDAPEENFRAAVTALRAHLEDLARSTPDTLEHTRRDVQRIVREFVAKRMQVL